MLTAISRNIFLFYAMQEKYTNENNTNKPSTLLGYVVPLKLSSRKFCNSDMQNLFIIGESHTSLRSLDMMFHILGNGKIENVFLELDAKDDISKLSVESEARKAALYAIRTMCDEKRIKIFNIDNSSATFDERNNKMAENIKKLSASNNLLLVGKNHIEDMQNLLSKKFNITSVNIETGDILDTMINKDAFNYNVHSVGNASFDFVKNLICQTSRSRAREF